MMTSDMKPFAIWFSGGMNGPEFCVIANRGDPPQLGEREAKMKLFEPMRIRPEDYGKTLDALRVLYPLPGSSAAKDAEERSDG